MARGISPNFFYKLNLLMTTIKLLFKRITHTWCFMDKLSAIEPSVELGPLDTLAHSIEYWVEQSDNYILIVTLLFNIIVI